MNILLLSALVVLIAMIGMWLLSLWLNDVSIVDIFWGLGFLLIAWVGFLNTSGYKPRSLVLCSLVTIWGGRLALHIGARNHLKDEDYRYKAMRRRFGERFRWISLVLVFGVQGLLMWIISVPIQLTLPAKLPSELTWLDALAVCVWSLGFFFESVGDWQLKRFKAHAENKGRVMDQGLWRYTRHPNYFGDSLMWWGIWLLAVAASKGLTSLASPVVMTILLLKVTGGPLLEKSLTKTKPEYNAYVERTNAFIPWLPRSRK